MLLIAVLATPNLAKPLCGDADLVKGSEAFITAVQLSFPSTFEAVIVIRVILLQHPVLLESEIFKVLRLKLADVGFDGALSLANHCFII